MKQLKINSRAFALALLIFGSCISEKDEDPKLISKISNFEVVGQTLSFKDFESYENAILDPKEILSLDFPSIAKLSKQGNASLNARVLSNEETKAIVEYQGSLILEILDEDRIVNFFTSILSIGW
jgi:hypothetical protein